MQIDTYAPCPCGSGKKIKFCCSKDLLHDIDKLVRTMEGKQYTSALEQTDKLIDKHGPRAALLSLQAETHLAMGQPEAAEKSASKLLEVMPHSSVGHSILAIHDILHDRVEEAVKRLQSAFENMNNVLPPAIGTALQMVARGLIGAQKILAARGHLLMLIAISGEELSEPMKLLMEVNQIPGMPALLKNDFRFSNCPEGAPWQGEFNAAMNSALQGAWLAASESLESLNQKAPHQPAIVRNMAILRSWLGEQTAAGELWRKYSTLPEVPEDEAVEAEALAQLLTGADTKEYLDVLRISYPIRDTEKLLETLLSDKRIEVLPIDSQDVAEEGQPPPKGAFRLLDRPMPASHEGLSHNDLPQVLADMLVYGKQTDREARLELEVERSPRFEESKTKLMEVVGEYVDPSAKEEVVSQSSKVAFLLNPEIRFPRDITQPRAVELLTAHRDSVYMSVWPNTPFPSLDGKTAREAAQDPQLRIRVQALILNSELASEESRPDQVFDFNRLRQELGLPTRGVYTFSGEAISEVPVWMLARLDFANLSDDRLFECFELARMRNTRLAILRSGKEILNRPEMAKKMDLAEVYEALLSVSTDTKEALHYIESGRRMSMSKGKSPAPWYLLELQVHLSQYEPHEANRVIKLLSRHSQEPGIQQALYQVLVRYGIISPDGRPRDLPAGGEPMQEEPAMAGPAKPAELWTPESGDQKQESKLWLPGMP